MKTIKKVEICIHFTDGTKEESIGTFEEVQDFMQDAESAHYLNSEGEILSWWRSLTKDEWDSLASKYFPDKYWYELSDEQVAYLYTQEIGIATPSNITLQGAYKSKMDIDTKESQWTGGPSTGTSKHGPQI